jgi:hypothetical protein
MPINPNIAMGAQAPAPVNFLGQMGQMLALKAAAQDVQGGEALRDFYTKGGDATTPEGVRALMAANPKMGMQILKGQSEMSARDVETQAKSLKAIKDNVSLVNSPEGMVEFLRGAYSTPGGVLLAKLAPLDKAIAAIPTDPKAFADYKRNLGLTSENLFESANSQLSARTSITTTGMTNRQSDINSLRTDTRERERRELVPLDDGFGVKDMYGNVDRLQGYGTLRGPNAPPPAAPVMPPAAANAFVTTAKPSVNALAPTAPQVVQPGSPTVANALAMDAQNNVPRPKQPLRQPSLVRVNDPANPGQKLEVDANVYKQGTSLGAPGVIGVASTESLTPAQKLKLKGEISKDYEALQRVVGQTNELLESIDAVKSSNLDRVAGPITARTFTLSGEGKTAETRFENLKGKVTAIAKANASLGGAIGSIANQEWQILANQLAVLDLKNGKEPTLEQIDQLERQAMSIVSRMQDGFQRQYGADVETLAPQYKDVPNVNYTPGQYTTTGKKTSSVDNKNPWLK